MKNEEIVYVKTTTFNREELRLLDDAMMELFRSANSYLDGIYGHLEDAKFRRKESPEILRNLKVRVKQEVERLEKINALHELVYRMSKHACS
jgi:hypothetical protein